LLPIRYCKARLHRIPTLVPPPLASLPLKVDSGQFQKLSIVDTL
jgi:hypothetical protein